MSLIQLPIRPIDAHKGDFGHVLIIGGSESMPGAPALCGLAALRSGVGLVTIATSREAHPITAGFSPALMTVPLPSQSGRIAANADFLKDLLDRVDVVAIGPGLGKSTDLQRLTMDLYRTLNKPMVVDADGLNNLAAALIDWSAHAGPRVLTPHIGEFRRIIAARTAAIQVSHGSPSNQNEFLEQAVEFARSDKLVLVLKSHHSLITDGSTIHTNTTGNSGMATAGTGDVLTGMIAALIGQHLSPLSAAVTASHVHGLAGELAAAELGEIPLISTDLLRFVSPAFLTLSSTAR